MAQCTEVLAGQVGWPEFRLPERPQKLVTAAQTSLVPVPSYEKGIVETGEFLEAHGSANQGQQQEDPEGCPLTCQHVLWHSYVHMHICEQAYIYHTHTTYTLANKKASVTILSYLCWRINL